MENRAVVRFFPITDEALDRFAARNLSDAMELDVVGSWLAAEASLRDIFPRAQICALADIEPYFHSEPWTIALEGLRVLVVHPFAGSIEAQYNKRQLIWGGSNILPNFNLITVPAVQTIAGERAGYTSWFDALEEMETVISKIKFDVALIGAGAYGFPLAAHVSDLKGWRFTWEARFKYCLESGGRAGSLARNSSAL